MHSSGGRTWPATPAPRFSGRSSAARPSRSGGIGEVNRKSLTGTFAGFVASLALCSWLVSAHNLPASWMGLAIGVSVSNTLLELFSPRGTDDFTMATANAFLCWGFGLLVYGGQAHP